jgi:hypothetical protein
MLSNKRHEIYPGSGRGGRTSSSGVLKALYCSAPGVLVVGLLQARWERKRGFQVPSGVAEDTVGELENEYVACYVLLSSCIRLRPSPPRLEGSLPFYRSRGLRITMRAALSSYVGKCDVLCCRVGGYPDDPCGDLAIVAYLVPEQW